MPKYAVLIYEDESAYANAGQEAWDAVYRAHEEFGQKNGDVLRGGEALQPTATATSVRQADQGEHLVTDGPFAETREALGGFYIVEAADLDHALELAKQVPARFGGVEVRPVMAFE